MVWLCWVDSSSRTLCIGHTFFKAKITFDLPGRLLLCQCTASSPSLPFFCKSSTPPSASESSVENEVFLGPLRAQEYFHTEPNRTITLRPLCAEQMCDRSSSLQQTARRCRDIVMRTRFSSVEAQSASVPPSQCSLTGSLQTPCFCFCRVCEFVFHVSGANSGHGWFIYPFSTVHSVSVWAEPGY